MCLSLLEKLAALSIMFALVLLLALMTANGSTEREIESIILCEDGSCTPLDLDHVTIIYKD